MSLIGWIDGWIGREGRECDTRTGNMEWRIAPVLMHAVLHKCIHVLHIAAHVAAHVHTSAMRKTPMDCPNECQIIGTWQ